MPVALLLLAVSLVLLPVNNLFRCRIEQIRKTYWKSLDDMTGYYMDSLRGLTTLKLFNRDQEHSRILGEKADILNYNINCFMKVNFTSFLVTEAMIYAAILFALVNSAGRIADGSMTIAQALIVLMLSYSYFSAAKELMNASHSALTAIAAAGKVEEILDTDTSRPYEPSLPEDPKHFEGIRMDHVSYGYEGRSRALQDISLTVPKGTVAALVGLSGCGKSTFMRFLVSLDTPSEGEILYRGKDITKLKGEELRQNRQNIQMVFQDPTSSFNPKMKIRDIVCEPLLNFNRIRKNEKDAACRRLLEMVELPGDFVDRYPHNMSGGQRQRIVIARALVLNPEFVVCDEPVSALDVSVRAQVLNLIQELKKKKHLTYMFISHDLSVVKYISDRIAVMYLGRIVEIAEKNELYNNPQHPYTKALLSAIPIPDVDNKMKREILTGDVPSPLNPPSGCYFHTRCKYATERCKTECPALHDVGNGHMVACHLT
mgnify:CR=1 FL=1